MVMITTIIIIIIVYYYHHYYYYYYGYHYYYYYMGVILNRVHGFVKAGGRGSGTSMGTAVRTQKVDKGSAGPLRQRARRTWPPLYAHPGEPAGCPIMGHRANTTYTLVRTQMSTPGNRVLGTPSYIAPGYACVRV